MRCLAVALGLVACATPSSSSSSGALPGSLHEVPRARGVWSFEVGVTGDTSQITALEQAHKRAGEVCKAGYDVVEGTHTASMVSLTVQCRASERRTIYTSTPLWCARMKGIDNVVCAKNRDLCEGADAICESRPAAACFTATKVLDESVVEMCFASITECDNALHVAGNKDWRVQATNCDIVRQR